MPEELTEFARMLIQNCPWLVNQWAEKVNAAINNWNSDDHMEVLEPIVLDSSHLVCDIQELLSHVGYSDEQCGYGEFGK